MRFVSRHRVKTYCMNTVEPTELRKILDAENIKQIYANGNKAGQLYKN